MSRGFEVELEDELEFEAEDEDEALNGLGRSGMLGEEELEGAHELEDEYEAEDELEGEFEDEFESELEGEFEDEMESEDEYEIEGEDEYEGEDEDEAFLGGLAQRAGSFLGEGEDEWEAESEEEYFFGKIGRFIKRNSGFLKKIAKIAGPLVATAVGGPAAGALARAVTSQLEGEFEDELEGELEEMATAPVTGSQAYAEYLAAKASTTESESEAEAFAGSAVTLTLSARDLRQLQEMLPYLIRGASVLTRVLHRNPRTRPAVRLLPGIVNSAARTLATHAAMGTIRPADIGAVLAGSARRVLSDPRYQMGAARRHARGLAYAKRHRIHTRRGYGTGGRSRPGTYRTSPNARRHTNTITRRPAHVHTVSRNTRVTRPRAGYMRVVTPMVIRPRGGHPARTVRVVSDVRIPRGAVVAGKSASLTGKRR
ncbi:MAG: hypothetical protein QOE89_2149 [Pseudonocardiales bacterium]|jgi:hypothetical protein|nr:hypothetical protein [Pseudonocardiales bacterium]